MARLISGILFTLLFAVAAWLQLDDADGESSFWVVVYGVIAFLSLLFAFRVLPRLLAWPVAGAALAGAAAIAFQHHRSGDPWNPEAQFLAERVREAGGLLIAGVWLMVAGMIKRRPAP